MFDPYHKWLGIPKEKQPATHYQLLGIHPGERDPEVIEEAAIRQSTHLRGYQLGPHAALCTQLLNEIAEAKAVLLNPAKRSAYEAQVAPMAAPVVAAAVVPAVAVVANPPRRVAPNQPAIIRTPTVSLHDNDDRDDEEPRRRGYGAIARHDSSAGLKIAAIVLGVLLVSCIFVLGLYLLLRGGGDPAPIPNKAVVVNRPVPKPGPAPAPAPMPIEPMNPVVPGKAGKDRFLDRGDYVEDTQTGLLWQKDGAQSGRMHYYDAIKYATTVKFGGAFGWRVPKKEELTAIFPAADAPFVNTKYNPEPFRQGPGEWASYWTSDLDPRGPDYAYIYQWYAKGGANNCFASKNFAYVRCVHDPLKK